MLGGIEDVFHGILDLPFLIIGLLVQSLNGWIAAIGLLISGFVALLPAFPAVPTVPAGPAAALAWIAPLGAILAVFVVCLSLFVTYMGMKIALNWGKVNL